MKNQKQKKKMAREQRKNNNKKRENSQNSKVVKRKEIYELTAPFKSYLDNTSREKLLDLRSTYTSRVCTNCIF